MQKIDFEIRPDLGCTMSLKDTDCQRQSVVLTQVREEYRQRLLERPVEGAYEVESHCNSCLSSSHRQRLHALTKQNKLTYEISEIYGLLLWIRGNCLFCLSIGSVIFLQVS